jgi:hypothetical protein
MLAVPVRPLAGLVLAGPPDGPDRFHDSHDGSSSAFWGADRLPAHLAAKPRGGPGGRRSAGDGEAEQEVGSAEVSGFLAHKAESPG